MNYKSENISNTGIEYLKKIKYTFLNETTNFREIRLGDITENVIYRSSYPIFRIQPERDEVYKELIIDSGINCVLSLAENNDGIERIACIADWYNNIFKKQNVIGLDIQFDFNFDNNYEKKIFHYKLKQGLQFLINHKGPYLIHCNAGRDRTGFLTAILGLLCNSSIDEVIYDYLLSYGVKFANLKNDELNYTTGKIIYDQIDTIINGNLKDTYNLFKNIEQYFINDIGLTTDEIDLLRKILQKNI